MALSAADKDALELLATDIERVSSWMSGGREVEVLQLAEKARTIANGGSADLVATDAEEAKRQEEIEAARLALQKQQEEAEAKAAGKSSNSS